MPIIIFRAWRFRCTGQPSAAAAHCTDGGSWSGTGIIVSSLTTRYRDFVYVVSFGVQLWMYASPVVYPLSQVPGKWRAIYLINPMASVIETFKFMFIGAGGVSVYEYGMALG